MKNHPRLISGITVASGFAVWIITSPSRKPYLTLLAILIHELGHILAAVAVNAPIGGFRVVSGEARLSLGSNLISYGKELFICSAGPIFNLLSFFVAHRAGAKLLAEGALSFFATISVALAVFNLLPIGDFDGGRIVYCLLTATIGPQKSFFIVRLLSFMSLFCLWCISVFALIRSGTSLSLFLFSATLFFKIFPQDSPL